MAQIKITKEELQRDEFIDTTDRLYLWIRENWQSMVLAVAIVLVGYSGFVFYKSSRTGKLLGANDLIGRAVSRFDKASRDFGWATADRQKAMDEVAALCDEVRAEYEGTELAHQALFLKGTAEYLAGDNFEAAQKGEGTPRTERAIALFTEYVAEAPANDAFDRARGRIALGYAYENSYFLTGDEQDLQDAMSTYSQVADDEAAGFLRYEAKLAQARLLQYAYTDRSDDAEKLYREVIEARQAQYVELGDDATPAERAFRNFSLMSEQFSLAQTARIALLRMGIDVEEEYPLEKKAETAETGES